MLIKKIAAMVASCDYKDKREKKQQATHVTNVYTDFFPWNDTSGQVVGVQTAP